MSSLKTNTDKAIKEATDISPHLKGILQEMSDRVPDAVKHATEMRKLAYSFVRSQSVVVALALLGTSSSMFLGAISDLDRMAAACWLTAGVCCFINCCLFCLDARAAQAVLSSAKAHTLKDGLDVVRLHIRTARMYSTLCKTTDYQNVLFRASIVFNAGAMVVLGAKVIRMIIKLF